MWSIYALGSAFFAGMVSVLAKIGIKNTDSNLATALRTAVVAVFAWIVTFMAGSQKTLGLIDMKSIVFLILSGIATGGSWLCYFQALQIGDVNQVMVIDKSSIILTMILSFVFLGEKLTGMKAAAIGLIGMGTYFMIEYKKTGSRRAKSAGWFFYAALSAVLASLTSVLGKVGIEGIESNLGTAIRTVVVLIMAWVIVFMGKKQYGVKNIDKKGWLFIILSGIATGFSWLCYYRALQEGPASAVVPIDKLSIVVTVIFGYFILHERLSRLNLFGLIFIIIGTLILVF